MIKSKMIKSKKIKSEMIKSKMIKSKKIKSKMIKSKKIKSKTFSGGNNSQNLAKPELPKPSEIPKPELPKPVKIVDPYGGESSSNTTVFDPKRVKTSQTYNKLIENMKDAQLHNLFLDIARMKHEKPKPGLLQSPLCKRTLGFDIEKFNIIEKFKKQLENKNLNISNSERKHIEDYLEAQQNYQPEIMKKFTQAYSPQSKI